MNILLTGANGFIGSRLLPRLDHAGHQLKILSRKTIANLNNITQYQYDLSSKYNKLDDAFDGIDVIIHLASKVHDLSKEQSDDDYQRINVEGTQQLLAAAVQHRVKRFIYLSTIKVYGDGNLQDVNEDSKLLPDDPYGSSKLQCENVIRQTCSANDLEYVIIRPPLVFGPGVKANFFNLIRLVDSGLPLPFASINNQRSMIYVDNLCEFISQCCTDYKAKDQIYNVKDFDVSTSKLINTITRYLGKPNRLFRCPGFVLKLIGLLSNKKKQIGRLAGSLTIDNSKMLNHLNFRPLYDYETSVRHTVEWYLNNK